MEVSYGTVRRLDFSRTKHAMTSGGIRRVSLPVNAHLVYPIRDAVAKAYVHACIIRVYIRTRALVCDSSGITARAFRLSGGVPSAVVAAILSAVAGLAR